MVRRRMRSERRMGSSGSGWGGDRFPGSDSPYIADRKAKVDRPKKHYCGECFGPRSHYSGSLFCSRCEIALFGYREYKSFLRKANYQMRKYWSDRGQSRT